MKHLSVTSIASSMLSMRMFKVIPQGYTLYRNNLVVTTFEQVFDVLLEAHVKI
jgi:hypothetical protein